MKLKLLVLIAVLIALVECQSRRRFCRRNSDCRPKERCVLRRFSFYRYRLWTWGSWWRRGICKPRRDTTKQCRSGADCRATECCEIATQVSGRTKRQVVGRSGVCKPLRTIGNSCLTQYQDGKPSTSVLQCPCMNELTCVPDGNRLPQGLSGVCRKPPQQTSCTSGSDCGPNECCEMSTPRKGRKKRQAVPSSGVCKPLKVNGNSCFVQYPSGKPQGTVEQCPCTAGLSCVKDGGRVVPQGFTGVCRKPPQQTSCTSGSDCGPNECCEMSTPRRGRKKRQAVPSSGVCKPLKTNGNSCFVQYPSGKPQGTVEQCPCTAGLSCVKDGGRVVPQGFTGICKEPDAPVECTSGADCGPDECCKSKVRPIGRKKRQASGGVCEPMGKTQSSCLTMYKPGKPDSMVFACPCETGLTCVGSGIFDVPLGEAGTCQRS